MGRADADDYNFDGRPEVRLASNRLVALVSPSHGGHLYELDVRSICHNLLATLTRREEAYHEAVRAGESAADGDVASIHDRVVFKQAGLDQRLQYDRYRRKSLIDHFYPTDVSLDAVAAGEYQELGDFVDGAVRSPACAAIRTACRCSSRATAASAIGRCESPRASRSKPASRRSKSPTCSKVCRRASRSTSASSSISPACRPAATTAISTTPAAIRSASSARGSILTNVDYLGLTDEWLGIDVELRSDRPMHIWTFPIETVSQSEAGFELVHQSVVVQPHWFIEAGPRRPLERRR